MNILRELLQVLLNLNGRPSPSLAPALPATPRRWGKTVGKFAIGLSAPPLLIGQLSESFQIVVVMIGATIVVFALVAAWRLIDCVLELLKRVVSVKTATSEIHFESQYEHDGKSGAMTPVSSVVNDQTSAVSRPIVQAEVTNQSRADSLAS